MNTRDPLRFRWDHRSSVHRTTVKAANRVLARLPFESKYRATARLRDGKPPYSFVAPGDVVVQVGAPADTLLSGRSRGMHLALRSRGGAAIVVEPDPTSAEEFRARAAALGLDHVTVVNAGAWYERSTLSLRVDPTHPATNFLDGQVPYDAARQADFDLVEVPVLPLDEIVQEVLGRLVPIRLLSVTTNNSEREILRGIDGILDAGLQYLSLARTGEGYDELVRPLGFSYLVSDDRGFTYVRSSR